jgi:phi13 family phage major tail protein
MAKIGLKNFRYSKLDADENVTTPATLGKAVDCKVSIEKNSAELYADDGLAESDYSFKKGTVDLTVDEDADETFADLLGHEIGEDGEVVRNADDVAPYVALGRILTKQVNGVKSYKVEFLCKAQFNEPNADEKTKGESLEFGTSAISGTIHKKANGDWSKAKTFTTYEEASTYLDGLLTKSST